MEKLFMGYFTFFFFFFLYQLCNLVFLHVEHTRLGLTASQVPSSRMWPVATASDGTHLGDPVGKPSTPLPREPIHRVCSLVPHGFPYPAPQPPTASLVTSYLAFICFTFISGTSLSIYNTQPFLNIRHIQIRGSRSLK